MTRDVVSLESDRLIQRPLTAADAPDIFREFTPEITALMVPAPPETLAAAEAFVARAAERARRGLGFQLAVLRKEDGAFLGCSAAEGLSGRTPEIGIWIKKSAFGHGYGREAVGALIGRLRALAGYDYIIYPVDVRNTPSRRIAEYYGGRIARSFRQINQSGRALNLLEYRIYP